MCRGCPRQAKRFGTKGTQVNGRMTPRQVRKFCVLKSESMALLKAAMDDLGLLAHARDKVLRVAQTIADLEGHEIHRSLTWCLTLAKSGCPEVP